MNTKQITTNIKFLKSSHLIFHTQSLNQKISSSKLIPRPPISKIKKANYKKIQQILAKMNKIAKINSHQSPGTNFSKKVIQMRYEQ